MAYTAAAPASPEARRQVLQSYVAWAISQGARVESCSDYAASVISGQQVNHVLHFLIGLFTCGVWWVMWIILGLTGGETRSTIRVDEWGRAIIEGPLKRQAEGW